MAKSTIITNALDILSEIYSSVKLLEFEAILFRVERCAKGWMFTGEDKETGHLQQSSGER